MRLLLLLAVVAVCSAAPLPVLNLMIYGCGNDTEMEPFILDDQRDLLKDIPRDIVVNYILETATHGVFRIRMADGQFTRTVAPGYVNMTKESVLTSFLDTALQDRAEKYAFMYAGHGWGWYLMSEPGENTGLGFPLLRRLFQQRGVHLTVMAIDACTQANLESIYEIAPITDFFIGFEGISGYHGMVSPQFLRWLSKYHTQPREALEMITVDYIWRMTFENETTLDEPCDLSVINVTAIPPLVDYLRSLKLHDTEFDPSFDVTPAQPGLYDVKAVVTSLPRVKESWQERERVETLFQNTNLMYLRCYNNPKTWMRGLSMVLSLVNTEETQTSCRFYKELQLSNLVQRDRYPIPDCSRFPPSSPHPMAGRQFAKTRTPHTSPRRPAVWF